MFVFQGSRFKVQLIVMFFFLHVKKHEEAKLIPRSSSQHFNDCCDPVAHTHLPTAQSSVCVPSETRVPRRQAKLNTLSYNVKQLHRDGLSLPLCFSMKNYCTGPSGYKFSKKKKTFALVCCSFRFLSPNNI